MLIYDDGEQVFSVISVLDYCIMAGEQSAHVRLTDNSLLWVPTKYLWAIKL